MKNVKMRKNTEVDGMYTYKNVKKFEIAERKFNKTMNPELKSYGELTSFPRFFRAMMQYDKMAKVSEKGGMEHAKEKVRGVEMEIYCRWKSITLAEAIIHEEHFTLKSYAYTLITVVTAYSLPMRLGHESKLLITAMVGACANAFQAIYNQIRNNKRVKLIEKFEKFSDRIKVENAEDDSDRITKNATPAFAGYVPMGSM
jgi:hypothetical protein